MAKMGEQPPKGGVSLGAYKEKSAMAYFSKCSAVEFLLNCKE